MQIVSYDEDMKIKYAEHLRTFERCVARPCNPYGVSHTGHKLQLALLVLAFVQGTASFMLQPGLTLSMSSAWQAGDQGSCDFAG